MANNYSAECADAPASLRYQNIIAKRAGLSVSFNAKEKIFIWTGTREQFEATRLFKSSQKWDFKRVNWTHNCIGMRADFLRETSGLKLVQEVGRFFHRDAPSKRGREVVIAIAAEDTGYQRFRAAMLNPVTDSPEATAEGQP